LRSLVSRGSAAGVVVAFAVGVVVGLGAPRVFAGNDAHVRFTQRGGDAWAPTVAVRGVADGCDEVGLEAGDRRVTAELTGQRFLARVPLVRGENTVVAKCGGARAQQTYVRRDTELPAPVRANDAERRPAWVDKAVVYGVIPRNFGETGGFNDVTARLDYLRNLGVTALWLSPSNRTIEGDFGYAVTDYFGLRPDYGTEADFRRLVREAHRRGIKVLMDFVPNHTSVAHPYFKDAQLYGRASRYWNFYDRDADGQPTNYFDWTHLPNLNYDNPEVRTMIVDAFAHWVRDFDVDGFRVDVAWGVKQRRPDFWPYWRAQLKAIKPSLLLLAEASARDPYYVTHGFDAAYDWTDQLGQWAWEGVFDAATPGALVDALDSALASYRPGHLVFRFLNNNDTGPSFVARYGTDITRVASTLLLTLPGIPCVYTGEEVGAIFSPYEDTAPIVWRDRFRLRGHYKRLIALREELPALHGPGFKPLRARGAPGVYAYVRTVGRGAQPVLVVLNFARQPTSVRLALPAAFSGSLRDELNGGRVDAKEIPVEAYGSRVLVPEGKR
jgi:cyclomaltodextrinase / maltogenic alpha-amylase / neopullulanase